MLDRCELLKLIGASTTVQAANDWTARDFARHFKFEAVVDAIDIGSSTDAVEKYQESFDDDQVDIELCAALIRSIHAKAPLEASILLFLPGYDDIVRSVQSIRSIHGCKAVPLHSSVSPQDQRQVFQKFPGFRKVVCSTNIAETSLTIDDIVYVIDSGKVKEHTYDSTTGVDSLIPKWVSKASAKQRRGRAGRTRAGVCYHMFSLSRNAALEDFEAPEILRTPLTELCLVASILSSVYSMAIEEFLASAPDPPHPKVVAHAIDLLQKVDALDKDQQVTDFGQLLSNLSLDPQLAKMVTVGCLLGCLQPMLIVAAAQAHRDPFQSPMNPKLKQAAARAQSDAFGKGTCAEHYSLIGAYTGWKNAGMNRRWVHAGVGGGGLYCLPS